MKNDVVDINSEIMGGLPVFTGTRVPVETLFDHLESGISIDAFLDDYPTVSREQVSQVVALAGKLLTTNNIVRFYEAAS